MQKLRLPDRRTLAIAVVAVVAALALAGYLLRSSGKSAGFKTAQVKRGDLQATISATGTVEPEEVVDIGAQVAGRIVSFGKDKSGEEVDYGSVVEAGMVLARIDDALYAADAATNRAQLAQAKAAVQKAQADLGQMQAKLLQTENDWKRAQNWDHRMPCRKPTSTRLVQTMKLPRPILVLAKPPSSRRKAPCPRPKPP